MLEAIEQQVLRPEHLVYAVDKALALLLERRREQPDRARQADAELKRLRRELSKLVSLAARGAAPKTILHEIASREARATS